MGDTLKIKKLSSEGNCVISIRIGKDIVKKLDDIAGETNRSRNELINIILEYGIENTELV